MRDHSQAGITPQRAGLRAIPGGVWALGLVSLCMDLSSELIHGLLPVYLVAVLGTSMTTVGMIEGVAEATAAITKVFSGALSDWMGRRKILVLTGYGLAALTKPVFALATSVGWLVAARFVDRIGKGIRGAPRDALIADLSPPELRGASFGLRQALDTVGAFLGPLAAMGLMWWTANDIPTVFWIAVIPAALAVLVLLLGVRDPDPVRAHAPVRAPLSRAELARLGAPYWWLVAIATLYTLARFSEAFLILKAQASGLGLALVPAVLVVMNVAYAAAAYPAGALSDRGDRSAVLMTGLVLLLAADLVLAGSDSLWVIAGGVALWGIHMGFTQGVLASMVADVAPAELRGTAFGMLNLTTGVALLLASVLAGALWDLAGAVATFSTGAALTVAAMLALQLARGRIRPR
ncbi:MAG: MFS transporter [Pseudomonadales bacterium]